MINGKRISKIATAITSINIEIELCGTPNYNAKDLKLFPVVK